MKTLLVIDMQYDFIVGSLGTPEARAVVPKVKAKIDESIEKGDVIIYTRDTHYEDYPNTLEGQKLPVEHCRFGTLGWKIPEELLPPADYTNTHTLDKISFGETRLGNIITAYTDPLKLTEIEIIGLCTDICVVSNAIILKSMFPYVEITVDSTCCAGSTPENHEVALRVMEYCQINVRK